MAGTTGLEPATSAVTAKRKPVTIRNYTPRMVIFGVNSNGQEQYWTLNGPATFAL